MLFAGLAIPNLISTPLCGRWLTIKLGICTVVYNQPLFVQRTIDALLQNTVGDYCYCLIFNNSPYKGTRDVVERFASRVDKIIYNIENLGVSAAYNQGFDYLKIQKVDFYLKLDDDTVIETRDWDKRMLDAFTAFPELGVLSADIDMGKQVGDHVEMTNKGTTIQVFENPSVGGACTMYPMKIFDSLGLFNNFGFYGQEDGEFASRVRSAGYMTAYLKGTNVKHLGRGEGSDPFYDSWKLEYWYRRTELDYPTWLKANKEDKEEKWAKQ